MQIFNSNTRTTVVALVVLLGMSSCSVKKENNVVSPVKDSIEGWMPGALRASLRPEFSYSPEGGYKDRGSFIITMGDKKGLQGYWTKTFKVKGDQYYYFSAFRKTTNVTNPTRRAIVTIQWLDEDGKPPLMDSTIDLLAKDTWKGGVIPEWARKARPEYPVAQPDDRPGQGWVKLTGYYKTPPEAAYAKVKLYLMWAPGGSVAWSAITLADTTRTTRNIVRVATVQYGPVDTLAKTTEGAISLFEPMIKAASEKNADIILLPEIITTRFSTVGYVQAAQPVPGPDTKYLGTLAKKYHIYIIAGLLESDSGQIFNTTVLMGKDGSLKGRYRKVTLPREEYLTYGTSPGEEYPVFNTSFGKIGIMTCWDVQFPQIARELAENGAQIIFMPNGGGNVTLTKARSIENQVYLVNSTWSQRANWLRSGIVNYEGKFIAEGKYKGDVVIADIDLNEPIYWAHLGNLKNTIIHQRPDRVQQ